MALITGKRFLVETLRAEGVRHIFGNPGSTEVPVLDSLVDAPDLTYVLALHEAAAMAMADGYIRASGKPAVAMVHTTPGTANALGNLFNAWRSRTPVVVIAGQQDSRMLLGEPFLASDNARLASQFTKWSYQVSRADELPTALRRAFKVAQAPPTGPVYLTIPKDFLEETIEATVEPPDRYRVATEVRGDRAALERAARLLLAAERPLVLVGNGVGRAGAAAELVEVAELLAARVYAEPFMVHASFPTRHPLFTGGGGNWSADLPEVLDWADVALAVGYEVFQEFSLASRPMIPAHVKLIHVELDAWEIAKNWPTDVGILAHPRLAIREIADLIKENLDDAAAGRIARRRPEVERLGQAYRQEIEEVARRQHGERPIRSSRFFRELRAATSPDTIVVHEAVNNIAYLLKYYDALEPGTLFAEKAGYLGWGLPAAIGAQLGCPGRQVLGVTGDGSALYAIQALWTAGRYQVPVKLFVLNNGCYMAVKGHFTRYGGRAAQTGRYVGAEFGHQDFPTLARGFGLPAERLEDPEQIAPTLQRVLAADGPVLVDVMVNPNDPGYGNADLPVRPAQEVPAGS